MYHDYIQTLHVTETHEISIIPIFQIYLHAFIKAVTWFLVFLWD